MSTLKTQARAGLDRLPLFEDQSHILECESGDFRLHCELTHLDKLACAFNHLGIESESLAAASMDRLRQVSEELAKRLTYLLEPIGPIEIDSDQCVVQLRSIPPQKDQEGTTYYELLIKHGGLLSLCRFVKQVGAVRHIIPAQVTREVFLRLVDDFSLTAR